MKKMFFKIFVFNFLFMLLSCNKQNKVEAQFVINMELVSFNDKEIQIFYLLNVDDSYSEENSIKRFVRGSENVQEISFFLENGIKPKNFRIDFDGPSSDSIELKSFCFKYNDQFFTGNDEMYLDLFEANINVSYDKEKKMFFFEEFDGFYDPAFVGNQYLNSKIVKLFVPNIYEFDQK